MVGCGFGEDALRLSKLGADVSAFDLSPDSLQIARALADREHIAVDLKEMPAERMQYADSTFDCIIARDILHHVDIPSTMNEVCRVAKPNALLIVNEIYSHSFTDKIRRAKVVEEQIYPRMRKLIYGAGKPYITEDERKLSELDLAEIVSHLREPVFFRYFNFFVTRLVPDYEFPAKVDQLVLRALKPVGRLLAGRILFGAKIRKEPGTFIPRDAAALRERCLLLCESRTRSACDRLLVGVILHVLVHCDAASRRQPAHSRPALVYATRPRQWYVPI